jgi:CO/xanthine dehydrogenase FAD-binding subunit
MPDELIARFILPKPKPGHREVFRKLGTRAAQAISKVVGSCRGRVEDGVIKYCRVALGSVAPVPVRLMEFESWIAGRKVDPTMLDEAEKVVSSLIKPIDDIRSTAEYRKWVSGRLVRSMLEEMVVN